MQVHKRLVYGPGVLPPVAGRWRKIHITHLPWVKQFSFGSLVKSPDFDNHHRVSVDCEP
jgi:hypothetical protein